jgi:hypothetical protein
MKCEVCGREWHCPSQGGCDTVDGQVVCSPLCGELVPHPTEKGGAAIQRKVLGIHHLLKRYRNAVMAGDTPSLGDIHTAIDQLTILGGLLELYPPQA